jgi:type I restriction enzyme R subunit
LLTRFAQVLNGRSGQGEEIGSSPLHGRAKYSQKLNDAFGKDISDKDKVAFAVHVSEKLRDNSQVMAQVKNATRDDAMKADLPMAINAAIAGRHADASEFGDKIAKSRG